MVYMAFAVFALGLVFKFAVVAFSPRIKGRLGACLLYTSDAADDLLCVDLGGRRIIKKKTKIHTRSTTTSINTQL